MNNVFRVLSLAGGLAVLLTGCADAPLSAEAPEVETKSLFETRYEAEHHAAMDGCETGSSRSGFTGDGYMKFGPEGAFVEWADVEVPDSDTYAITLRYSARGDATRQGKFIVNGEPVEFLRFTRTGDTWSDWGTLTAAVPLRAGSNTVRIQTTGRRGPYLDHMDIEISSDDARPPAEPPATEPPPAEPPVEPAAAIQLPIEVMGPSGTEETVEVVLDDSVAGISHLLVTCHACGYHDHDLDSDPRRTKAAVRLNGGPQIALQHYTLGDDGIVGNRDIRLVASDDAAYGGVGGAFRTNTMVVPISGLRRGRNTLTFIHVDRDHASIGFRILGFDFLRGDDENATVLPPSIFRHDDPAQWTVADAIGRDDRSAQADAIRAGRALWYREGHLYDPAVDALDGEMGRGTRPLDGRIRASCSGCHAQDGRDLAYFNFSNHSIVERSVFHGLSRVDGRNIAAYIRSLDVPVVDAARPWNPPYQPGPGLDDRPVYEWAAGAGIDAVLDTDAEMEPYLFPEGTSAGAIRRVVDRFSTLNLRELPVALQMPDWNQWLPTIHPMDAFDTSASAVRRDERGNRVDGPFYDVLYEEAADDPSARNLGDMVTRTEKWLKRGSSCYTQQVGNGPGWRSTNGDVLRATQLGRTIDGDIDDDECRDVRHSRRRTRHLELAKRGLLAWITVKQWEIQHTQGLEDRGSTLVEPVCAGGRCVDASERGWFTTDRNNEGPNVFNRAPHYVGFNADQFTHQHELVGHYESTAWYHVQLILNPGYRRTAPSHFVYVMGEVERLYEHSGVSQSFRFWAGAIKQRQTQTNGRYGVEAGLDLRSSQPYRFYSDKRGDTSVRAGVGRRIWTRILDAMLVDLAEDASNGRQRDWDSATGNRGVQDRDSRDFESCERCFRSLGSPMPFNEDEAQGLHTVRVIPRFRELGVSEDALNTLIDWCEDMWPRGPWEDLRE